MTATIVIGDWRSFCSACGNGADWQEKGHTTRLDYGEHDGRGCDAEFVAVSADMSGRATPEDVAKMREDLPYVQWSDPFRAPEL